MRVVQEENILQNPEKKKEREIMRFTKNMEYFPTSITLYNGYNVKLKKGSVEVIYLKRVTNYLTIILLGNIYDVK